jgi:hypothetical protein
LLGAAEAEKFIANLRARVQSPPPLTRRNVAGDGHTNTLPLSNKNSNEPPPDARLSGVVAHTAPFEPETQRILLPSTIAIDVEQQACARSHVKTETS